MKNRLNKEIERLIHSTLRADRQEQDDEDIIEDNDMRKIFCDEEKSNARIKAIDRIIRAYQAKKLMLKAQELRQSNIEEQKRTDLINRMIKGYNKNRHVITSKPKQTELPQSEKRKRKLADLNSRSNSWNGLECFSCNHTGENQ